jgi:hypothetical protein
MSDDGSKSRDLAVRGEITRAELARLRRGELDADTIKALMQLSQGLGAPAAPPEGDLVPNGTGWRVGEGGPTLRLYPRALRGALWTGAILCYGNWAMALGLAPSSFLLVMLANLLPLAALVGAVRVATGVTLRRLARAPAVERLADCASGAAVRVTGVVADGPTVRTLFRGSPAVLFKSAVPMAQQTQGIDFDLDLESGERARISVRRAMLLDPGRRTHEPPACGPVGVDGNRLTSLIFRPPSLLARLLGRARHYEVSVAPGDRIEVCGVLHHEPAPEALAPFAREMPTRAVVRAPRGKPLLVRRVG